MRERRRYPQSPRLAALAATGAMEALADLARSAGMSGMAEPPVQGYRRSTPVRRVSGQR